MIGCSFNRPSDSSSSTADDLPVTEEGIMEAIEDEIADAVMQELLQETFPLRNAV